ncbi:phosphatase PAP2 family protein [Rubrobacter calidifluminis]|uniref:phosphatase PAP2 family protein n=1 Tax=Rubrobacter calidifluminis TaxID=1392640 RepID=UPI002360962B|nr:phosphatase PAP2 family protein [Rubrobacter calidifluminis]
MNPKGAGGRGGSRHTSRGGRDARGASCLGVSALLLLAAFAALAYAVSRGVTRSLDVAVMMEVHGVFSPSIEGLMVAATTLGYYSVVTVLLAVCVVLFYLRGLRWHALYMPVCTVGDMVLTTIVKDTVERIRPHLFHFPGYPIPHSFSFPSGHADMAVAFYGVLALLLARLLSGGWRWLVLAAGLLLVLIIGFSRIYLGVHYPSDVLGGYLLAGFWASLTGSAFVLLQERF